MSKFISKRFNICVVVMVVFMAIVSLDFYYLQNNSGRIGGEIALSKMVWLTYAILFWIGLPLLISLNSHVLARLKTAFIFLLVSMLLRGLVELWMLYFSKNWSPVYGIMHDVFCILGLGFFLWRAWETTDLSANSPSRIWFIHGIISTLIFIPEIYYAWYMYNNFNTVGGNAIYFVPNILLHNQVLFITASVNVLLTIYLVLFFRYLFYGQSKS